MSLLKKMYSMRLSMSLMSGLKKAAQKDGRTRTGLIEFILACWLEKHERESKGA